MRPMRTQLSAGTSPANRQALRPARPAQRRPGDRVGERSAQVADGVQVEGQPVAGAVGRLAGRSAVMITGAQAAVTAW